MAALIRLVPWALCLALVTGCEPAGPEAASFEGKPELAPVAGERFVAPDFSLRDLAGGELALGALRGRPVVIDFWATWCAPCERQIPVLNAFHEKYGERIPVLGISVDVDPSSVPPFVEKHAIRYRVLLGDEGLAHDFGARGYPWLFVLRPDGSVHSAHVGVVSPEALEAAVAEWSRF